jgi:hypothetical protein
MSETVSVTAEVDAIFLKLGEEFRIISKRLLYIMFSVRKCHTKQHINNTRLYDLYKLVSSNLASCLDDEICTVLSNIKYTPSPYGAGSIDDILDKGGRPTKLKFGVPNFNFYGMWIFLRIKM